MLIIGQRRGERVVEDCDRFEEVDAMLFQVTCSLRRIKLKAQTRWKHGGILADAGEDRGGAGVNQPKIPALKHYKLEGFSVERLMHFATALEHDVVIEIRAKAARKGRILIVGAA